MVKGVETRRGVHATRVHVTLTGTRCGRPGKGSLLKVSVPARII
jgi:hypothetical protein